MEDIKISEQKLNEGIKLCIDKSKQLLADAQILIDNNSSLVHAVGLYIFALEEYGKALYMKEAKVNGKYRILPKWVFAKGDMPSEVRKTLPSIRSKNVAIHEAKIGKALSTLPSGCKNLIDRVLSVSVLSNSGNKPIVVRKRGKTVEFGNAETGLKEDTTSPLINEKTGKLVSVEAHADFSTRMSCFYVDWDTSRNGWKEEPCVDKDLLTYAMCELAQKLD